MIKIKELINKYLEVILYLFFGGLSFVLNIFIYVCLTKIYHLNELFANAVSWIIVILFVFITNRKWVFDSGKERGIKQFINFVYTRVATLIMEEVVLYIGITVLSIKDLYVKVLGQIVVIIVNYIFSKCIVFKDK